MKKLIAGMLTAYSILLIGKPVLGCTDFRLTAQDGTTLIARSMEFSIDMQSNLRTSTQNRLFTQVTPDGKSGISWKAKYGYVFLDAFQHDFAIDGMNEQGLSIEGLYLPGETQYQTIPTGHENQGLFYLNFGDWVLGNFKTVDEVRHALPNVFVFSQTVPGMGDMVFPLHFAIYDATGKGIIVEFVGGKQHVYDNEVGVLTNSPTYDWQVTNLRNYVNLSPYTPSPVVIGKLVFASTGQGSGMKGLPGDISPPSRFVKMATMKATAYQAKTANEALNVAQHLINNVDIPAGFVRAMHDGKENVETTQWTIFKDLTNKIFYYRTYGDTTLHAVSLSKLNFSEKSARLKMPIADAQYILDMTDRFQQTKAS
ncbi:MAG: hypothetical protein ACD_46C00291G0005 [uncultured bacterium]|nr:MAG: hypothetical protein ACD_46C00291G0005 [uncultured bacterium]